MLEEHRQDVVGQLLPAVATPASGEQRLAPLPGRRDPVPLECRVRLDHEPPYGLGVARVEDRAPLREHVHVVHQLTQLAEVVLVDVDARPARRQHHRQQLGDREQVDRGGVDELVEELVEHGREQVPFVQPQDVGPELRVLDPAPRAVHLAVADGHHPVADVALRVRARVERARQVRVEQRLADLLVAVQDDGGREAGQQLARGFRLLACPVDPSSRHGAPRRRG